jgi:hypothetical protein
VYDAEVGLSAAVGGAFALGVVLGSPAGALAAAPHETLVADTLLADRPVALYPLQPEGGLDRTSAAALEERLREDMQRTPGVTLFSRNDTAAMLRPEGGRLGLSCDTGALRCLSDLGRLLGARKVIYGQVGPERVFLKLVDVETGGEERRVEESGLPVTDLLEAAAVHLLEPKRYLGSIAVNAPAGATISVDGTPVGTAPLAPLAVSPGQHLLTASLGGGPDLLATVEVRFGQTAQADLHPSVPGGEAGRERGLSRWGIGFLAGAVALTTAGIVTGTISQQNRYAVSGMAFPVPQSDAALVQQRLGNAHDYALAANVLFVAAGAAAITGVILLLVDHPQTGEATGTVAVSPGGAGVHF